MGCCCCCASGKDRVLPVPEPDQSEYEQFQKLLSEDVGPGGAHGWQIKQDWAKDYKQHFKMRICLRNHESGNPNKLLRADGKYQGVSPEDFLGFLLNPENLPGLKEWIDVETLPEGYIKYCRVKADVLSNAVGGGWSWPSWGSMPTADAFLADSNGTALIRALNSALKSFEHGCHNFRKLPNWCFLLTFLCMCN